MQSCIKLKKMLTKLKYVKSETVKPPLVAAVESEQLYPLAFV